MRSLDGVTFISDFGRRSAFAECPDLDPDRLHVVSCGADPTPSEGSLHPERPLDVATSFVVCLASTFWHKNRTHAIATFAALAEQHDYDGHLVIAGPEPYYGRSSGTEDDVISQLPTDVGSRVHRWGHISEDEKWWLLRHADAALYPSVVEGFGLVPFEAAAVGTPCLAHDGTAQAELLGGTDAVIASWNPGDWARRIAEWIADRDLATSVVDSTRRVGDTHTWERCAEQTWEAIDHALATPRRSFHDEDGGALARVAGAAARLPSTTSLRFDVARGVPAVERRLRRVIASRGTKESS
jgi:glycosyltransferase involved in cell wall biosynthesis